MEQWKNYCSEKGFAATSHVNEILKDFLSGELKYVNGEPEAVTNTSANDSIESLINQKARDWANDPDVWDAMSPDRKAELVFQRAPKPKIADADLEREQLNLSACLEHLPTHNKLYEEFVKVRAKLMQREAELMAMEYFVKIFKDDHQWQYKYFRQLFGVDIVQILKKYVLYCNEVNIDEELNKFHFWVERLYKNYVDKLDPETEKLLAPEREKFKKEVWAKEVPYRY